MGILGAYLDGLSDGARDRVIEAQDWCIAAVTGAGDARCLVGHAEDWRVLRAEAGAWRSWLGRAPGVGSGAECGDAAAFSPELFVFRRAAPGDGEAYRHRVARWGLEGERRIGDRFDRLCVRRGAAGAVALVKRRAASGAGAAAGAATYGAIGVQRRSCAARQLAPGASVTGDSTCAASTQSIARYSSSSMSAIAAASRAPGFQTTAS